MARYEWGDVLMLANRVRFGAGGRVRFDPTTWKGIQAIVRENVVLDYFEIGSQIESTFDGDPMIWDIIGINHDIPTNTNYSNSITLQTHDIVDGRAWHSSHVNRYISSTSRTYLNNTSTTGFIGKIDPALAVVLGAANKQVAKADAYGGGQDLFSDKVFHLSRLEVGFASEGTTTGENTYAFYAEKEAAARIKMNDGSADYWALRSPRVDGTNTIRSVSKIGFLGAMMITDKNNGFAPALVII